MYQSLNLPLQDQQGQALPEVPEEADRSAREGQEEEGGDVQRPPGHEEGRKVDISVYPVSPLNPFYAVLSHRRLNKSFRVRFSAPENESHRSCRCPIPPVLGPDSIGL